MDNNDIIRKINSNDPEAIREAVQAVKENGDLTTADELLQQLEFISDPHTVTIVVNLLADIKDNNFREILIQKIKATHSPAMLCQLLRIVWESSLDYSASLDIFLQLLSQDDFSVAFEASTVIENMVNHLNKDQQNALHHFMAHFPEEKQFLIENIHEEMHSCEEEEDA